MGLNINSKSKDSHPSTKFSVKVGDVLEMDYEGATFIGHVTKIDESYLYMTGARQVMNGNHFPVGKENEMMPFNRQGIRPIQVHSQLKKGQK